MSESSVLELAGVERTFRQAGQPLKILRGASLRLSAGEMVALLGRRAPVNRHCCT